MKRIGVDIGGTFTDIVYIDDDAAILVTDKVRSTPSDLARAIFAAIRKIGGDLSGVDLFVHGTTVGLNTVVQRTGARVGLITTDGFTDVLEMARGDRKELYNYLWKKPKPLVPRSLRLGIRERTDPLGRVVTRVHIEDVESAIETFRLGGVESIAVCLLHSYANPENEIVTGEVVHRLWPQAEVSLSYRVAREFREYERTSTTVLDAYIKRQVAGYLGQVTGRLRGLGFGGQVLIVSPSGVLGVHAIQEKTIATFASGPIGGVSGAVHLAELTGYRNLVTMDVGGTSFDVSLVKDAQPVIRHRFELLGYPVLMPGMDIRPIGAGGGSIARVDAGGLLTVGPDSAGAEPGPMCYGLGGTEPTVTDAALVNGLIDPAFFLGGEIKLDLELAREGIGRIATRLGLSLPAAAEGILTVARDNMTAATKEILTGQGHDPREFSLVSYGGAGGIFAAGIAWDMSMPRVIVPPTPGVFSARGMLTMDLVHPFVQTYVRSLETVDPAELMDVYTGMEEEGRRMLREERIPAAAMSFVRSLDMCYEGQGHYVEVSVPGGELGEDVRPAIAASFHALHRVRYGHCMQATPKTINVRLKAIGKIEQVAVKRETARAEVSPRAFKPSRCVYAGGELSEWKVLDRGELAPGNTIEGPAIVEEPHHVTAVPPGRTVAIDAFRNLIVSLPTEERPWDR